MAAPSSPRITPNLSLPATCKEQGVALRALVILTLAASLGVLGGATATARGDDAPASGVLGQFDTALENLYKQSTACLVRVSVIQSAAAVLDSRPGLKAAFDDYRKNLPPGNQNNGGPPGGGRGRG